MIGIDKKEQAAIIANLNTLYLGYSVNNTVIRFNSGKNWDTVADNSLVMFLSRNKYVPVFDMYPTHFLISKPRSYWYGMYASLLGLKETYNRFINFEITRDSHFYP